MAWTAPMTFTPNSPPTASQLNASLRDNLLETMPAKATSYGSFFIASGVNAVIEKVSEVHFVDAAETTSSTTFTNLATVGPTVSVTTGVHALVLWTAELNNDSLSSDLATVRMTMDVTGASTLPGTDTRSLCNATPADGAFQGFHAVWYDDLTPGVNTFTAKYRVSSGTGTFRDRRLQVIPY